MWHKEDAINKTLRNLPEKWLGRAMNGQKARIFKHEFKDGRQYWVLSVPFHAFNYHYPTWHRCIDALWEFCEREENSPEDELEQARRWQ